VNPRGKGGKKWLILRTENIEPRRNLTVFTRMNAAAECCPERSPGFSKDREKGDAVASAIAVETTHLRRGKERRLRHGCQQKEGGERLAPPRGRGGRLRSFFVANCL